MDIICCWRKRTTEILAFAVFTAVAVAVVITVGANPRSPFYQLVKNELISVVALTEMSDVEIHFPQQFLSCRQSYNDFFYSVVCLGL